MHKEFDAAMTNWNAVVFAKTEKEYEKSTENFYLALRRTATLLVHKEKFLHVWMRDIRQYGHLLEP